MKRNNSLLGWIFCLLAATILSSAPAAAQEEELPPRPRLLRPDDPDEGGLVSDTSEPIIAPKSPGRWSRRRIKPLPPFGTMIASLPATLHVRDETARIGLLAEGPKYVPAELPLLPSPLREAMEDTQFEDKVFLVSGRVTVYGGKCYLLPTRAVLLDKSPDKWQDPETETETDRAPQAPPSDAGARGPKEASDGEPEAVEADDIMERLLQRGAARPIVPEIRRRVKREDPQAEAKVVAASTADTDDEIVVNRLVYVIPEGKSGWREARFLSDNTLGKRPIRLLPNRVLDSITSGSGPGGRVGAYMVSGDVLIYRGREYLFLRKAVARRDLRL